MIKKKRNAPQARFFNEIKRAAGKNYKHNAPQARFLIES